MPYSRGSRTQMTKPRTRSRGAPGFQQTAYVSDFAGFEIVGRKQKHELGIRRMNFGCCPKNSAPTPANPPVVLGSAPGAHHAAWGNECHRELLTLGYTNNHMFSFCFAVGCVVYTGSPPKKEEEEEGGCSFSVAFEQALKRVPSNNDAPI